MDVSREIIERLKKYESLVLKWNKAINLVSTNAREDFWDRHIVDSLQLIQFIKNKDIHLIDVGSGAGLPGIVLSIAGIKYVTLVESDSRKAAFLLQASRVSNNKINIVNTLVENFTGECDIITSRAFASLSKTFAVCRNIKVQNKYLILKGASYVKDISESKTEWVFNCVLHNSITNRQGKVLEITDLKRLI